MTDDLNVLAPLDNNLDSCLCSALTGPFDNRVLSFFSSLSERLLQSKDYRQYSELVALGFWLRPAKLKALRKELTGVRKPLGTVIHFTPSNVDTMFIYSWVCSVLLGNRNIVRIASQKSEVRDKLITVMNELLQKEEFAYIASSTIFVSYDKQSHWSSILSEYADARVIWGGDESISDIRALPTSPRCRDICFADRFSISLINGEKLGLEGLLNLAERLWKDVEPYSQQACSSPRVLCWLGNTASQTALFQQLNLLAKSKQRIQQTNEHLVVSQICQSHLMAGTPLIMDAICVLPIESLPSQLLDWHAGDGLFYLLHFECLEDLNKYLTKKCQTLGYWGIDKEDLLKFIVSSSITGIDRIVPVGQALEFDTVWDGYDLFSELSRRVMLTN